MRKLFLTIALAGLALMAFAPAVSASSQGTPHKAYVCKYVGTPGVDERLQTGQNPIDVAFGAIAEDPVIPGTYFNDQHGRSYVLAIDVGQPAPEVTECPSTTPETTTSTTSSVPPSSTTTDSPTTLVTTTTTTSSTESPTTTTPPAPSTTTTLSSTTVPVTQPTVTTSTTPSPTTTEVPRETTTTGVASTTSRTSDGVVTIPETPSTGRPAVGTPSQPVVQPVGRLPRTGAASTALMALGLLLVAVGAILLVAFGGRRGD